MIPKNIFQTWKHHNLPLNFKLGQNSWIEKNPEYTYHYYDDNMCLNFVKKYYPHALKSYESLKTPVEKADLWRYMIVHQFGGVYADIDTTCVRPIKSWLNPSIKMLVCIEADNNGTIPVGYTSDVQYCQWTFAAEPGSPILKDLIDEIVNTPNKKWSDDQFMDILHLTGPGAFTRAVNRYRNLEGLVIAPGYLFACGTAYSGDESCTNPQVAVKHGFAGSWKGSDYLGKRMLVSGDSNKLLFSSVVAILTLLVLFYFRPKF